MLNLRRKNKKDKINENIDTEIDKLEVNDISDNNDVTMNENNSNSDDITEKEDALIDGALEDTGSGATDENGKMPWLDYAIYCDNLVKIYKTDEIEVMALQGLELEIKKGEFMAVIGKSGSGKSTLMNLIGGLETPTLGRIYVEGYNIADLNEKEKVNFRKKVIGFVWQKSERNLLQYLTAIDNVINAMAYTKMTNKEKYEKAINLLTMTGIEHKKDSYPSQMSGGEQQRVAIAVALANDPKILLADEPTGAVDSKTSGDLQDLFRELNRKLNLTIIIVTHDMKLANKVDRVVMISDGKISTEKVMRQEYRDKIDKLASNEEKDNALAENSHEEFSVLDKANRVQLTKEMLSEAGIDGKKVIVHIEDGKLVISGREN